MKIIYVFRNQKQVIIKTKYGLVMKLLTIKELSQILTVKEKTLYYLVHKNAIPHYRVNRLIRFNAADIKRWLDARKSKTISRPIAKKSPSPYTSGKGKPGHLKVKEVIDCCIKEARSGG